MINPPDAWYASFVTRWHAGPSSPWLAHTGDRTGWHGARMAILAIRYWPGASAELIRACIVHDEGEYRAGDMPQTAKRANPGLSRDMATIERECRDDMGMVMPDMFPEDLRRLKFLDRLDAYLWAQHHAPDLMRQTGWVADRNWLEFEAKALGVEMSQ